MAETLLILGGTAEAVALADQLSAGGHRVIYSLAGRTSTPRLPGTVIHHGGFGGTAGLAQYLADHAIHRLIDATHPFATQISQIAQAAARDASIPLLRLQRPGWKPEPGDRWIPARDIDDAFAKATTSGRRILVTSGRKGLDRLPRAAGLSWLIRLAEPGHDLPRRHDLRYLFSRGPFSKTEEYGLLTLHRIDCLISKNSGGNRAKLDAAATLDIPVVMIKRSDEAGIDSFESVEAVIAALG